MTVNSIDDVRGELHIDSRDLIELRDYMRTALSTDDDALDPDEREEFEAAVAAIDALEEQGITEWEDGAQLISTSAFEDYARELAEDIGAITGGENWPLNCIDWWHAARELRYDYSEVDFLGYAYLVRS
jgi:hypothetical protein